MEANNSLAQKWVPITEVAKFFNYKPTQLANLLKNKDLVVAKVGKRKFVQKDSLNKLLEASVLL